MAFIDMKKVFTHSGSIYRFGVEEWTVLLVQVMYTIARSQIFVGKGNSLSLVPYPSLYVSS